MRKIVIILCLLFFSCKEKNKADLIITNAKVYTVNADFDIANSIAIKNGKIIGVGTNTEINTRFYSKNIKDANQNIIIPGLIDAHCHFYGLGLQQQRVELTGTKSFNEVLERLVKFQEERKVSYITGRGWDQNNWKTKEFPTKEKLDQLFPNTPVAIRRIDGHALIANQKAIDLAGVTINTPFSEGEIVKKDGKLTGVFIDAPMKLIESKIPPTPKREKIQALIEAQKICISYGLTTVDDAGLSPNTIQLIDSLQKEKKLKIRVYAMVSASNKNIEYYKNKGKIKTNRLNVRSFKAYADGALGSRGATLKKPYTDKHNHYGALVTPLNKLESFAKKIAEIDFQMNTHAIGDSANYVVLKTYKKVLKGKQNKRWRIEHAQVIDKEDFKLFNNIIPSVQPTHATSDMYWAKDRLGSKRVKGAYANKELLNSYGKIALGTDFPIEKVNPFLTFYAAVVRKDLNNYPKDGYQKENALTRKEALKGMTIWAAYANFEEYEKGSIEIGKFADFIIIDKDILTVKEQEIPKTKVLATYINGEKVYQRN